MAIRAFRQTPACTRLRVSIRALFILRCRYIMISENKTEHPDRIGRYEALFYRSKPEKVFSSKIVKPLVIIN